MLVQVSTTDVRDADALSRAFITQLRTDPEMRPEMAMHWDALVDGVSNGFDLPPLEGRSLALTVGPLDGLHAGCAPSFAILGDWLAQLQARSECRGALSPRVRIAAHGEGAAFRTARPTRS